MRFSNGVAHNRSKVFVKKIISDSPLLTFRDPCSHICQMKLWMSESGDFDFGSYSILQTHFLREFEAPGGGIFKHVLREFERWDPDMFPKSRISKISCSSHSKNIHIKLNGFQSIFGSWGDMPFIFSYGLDVVIWPKSGVPHHPPELYIHLGGAIGS